MIAGYRMYPSWTSERARTETYSFDVTPCWGTTTIPSFSGHKAATYEKRTAWSYQLFIGAVRNRKDVLVPIPAGLFHPEAAEYQPFYLVSILALPPNEFTVVFHSQP